MSDKVVEFPTQAVQERRDLSAILDSLNELHAAGKLQSIAAYYITKDDEVFTWVSDSMTLSMLAYGLECLRNKLSRLIRVEDA